MTRRPAKRSRRDELLAIAADLFAKHGFSGVTVDDIGAAAGVSGPALYHHFDSKEALLAEMLVRISESLLANGQSIVAQCAPSDRLQALIAKHIDFAVDRRALITVHFRDLVQVPAPDARRVHDLQRTYVDIWVEALLHHRPTLDQRTARAAVHAAFGLINSTPFSGRLARDHMVDLLTTMARSALGAVGND